MMFLGMLQEMSLRQMVWSSNINISYAVLHRYIKCCSYSIDPVVVIAMSGDRSLTCRNICVHLFHRMQSIAMKKPSATTLHKN